MLFLDVAVAPEVAGIADVGAIVIGILVLAVLVGCFFIVRAIVKNKKK